VLPLVRERLESPLYVPRLQGAPQATQLHAPSGPVRRELRSQILARPRQMVPVAPHLALWQPRGMIPKEGAVF